LRSGAKRGTRYQREGKGWEENGERGCEDGRGEGRGRGGTERWRTVKESGKSGRRGGSVDEKREGMWSAR